MKNPAPPRPKPWPRWRAQRVVAVYAVFAGIWIYTSDRLLQELSSDPVLIARWSTFKGVGFVAITSALLLLLLRRAFGSLEESHAQLTAQQAIAQNEKLFSDTMIESMPGILYFYDANGKFLRWNRNFERASGYSGDEIARMTPPDFFSEQEKPVIQAKIAEVFAEGSAYVEAAFVSKDGSAKPYFFTGHRVMFDGRKCLVGVGLDISGQKRTEFALHESEERFHAFMDATPAITWVTDEQGRHLYMNRAWEKAFGLKRTEWLGKTAADLVPPAAAERIRRSDAEVLSRNQAIEIPEDSGELQGKKFCWNCIKFPFRNAAGQRFLGGVAIDITERKILEEQFLRAQRMESIGTLASGIAHDLNNVLAPILMSIALLKIKVPGNPDMHRQLDQLGTNTERGANLVRHLLTFGRGFTGERIPLQPKHIAREIAQLVEDTFPKNIDFSFTYDPEIWNMVGDPTQLHQILLNLCVNARDAMPHGGSLNLHLSNLLVDEKHAARAAGASPGPHIVLAVSDTGTGIPVGIREKIFDPFFTTKEPGKGTGLGLSTTLAIVRSHAGFLELESEEGKGTTFRIYLPAGNTDIPAVTACEPARLEGRSELILVVDDEAVIREVAKNILERFGYEVLLAENGIEAVSQYSLHRERVAAVITDMAMPIMGGPATILALRGVNPKVKIIASSGHGAEAARSEVDKAGANISHFIAKPYTAELLLQAVRSILSEGSHVPFKTPHAGG